MIGARNEIEKQLEHLHPAVTERRPPHLRLLAALLFVFFFSGGSGLMYQIVWLKFLTLAFGVTIYAVSTVLAGFMAGLALGSFAAGRVADRIRHPLRLYGLLEVLIGGVGLLSPSAFRWLQEVYEWLHPLLPDELLSLSLARFALAFIVLLVPTSLMGATLPIMVKSPFVAAAGLGRGVSLLYALNTFGAMAGTLLAGVFLIGDVGLQGTIMIAVGINITAGLSAIVLDMMIGRSSAPAIGPDQREAQPSAGTEAEYSRPVLLAVLIVFWLSGFCSLAYEVVWARILTFFTNGTTYAFTIMLATFLLGIAVGSYLINHFINRRYDWLIILVGVEFGVGLTSLLSIRVVSEIYQVLNWIDLLPFLGWLVHSETRFMAAVIAFTILPTTLLLGVAFPIGLRVFSSGKVQVGRRIGNLYAVNVFGSILGSFAAGFILVPLLGSQRSMTALALVNWLMVPLLIWSAGERYKKGLKLGIVLATATVMLLLVAVSPEMQRRIFETRFPNDQVVWFEEGLETTVSVHRNPELPVAMYLNGRHQASVGEHGSRLQLLIGHMPILLHPDPQEVLVIGLGGGATAGAISQHSVRQIDVIELSESVVKAADYFASLNNDVLQQPNLRLRLDDGRNYLLLTNKKYDVITADIIQPYYAGSGTLYSREYFQMAQNSLKPNGLMVQWIGELPEEQYKLIMRTFLSVFPNVTLWANGRLMVGTLQPQQVDPAVVQARFAEPRAKVALASLQLGSADDVLRLYNGSYDEMSRFVGDGPVSTDNQPYNEYFRSIPGYKGSRGDGASERNYAEHISGDVARILVR